VGDQFGQRRAQPLNNGAHGLRRGERIGSALASSGGSHGLITTSE
jgi:hypothetical protein